MSNETQLVSARSRADVNYLKKCTNSYEKVERSPKRKFVSVTQIYSRHEDAIQRSLDIAEHLANQPSPIKLDEKEKDRIVQEKEAERQQKLEKKAQQEEAAKRREKMEKEKKAKEAENEAVLQAEYEKSLKIPKSQGGKVKKNECFFFIWWKKQTNFLGHNNKKKQTLSSILHSYLSGKEETLV